MATPGYEGGIGGKFRKQPFRRVPAKPYDRPPSAARGGLRALSSEVGSGGWISKLAGDASRLIAVGASRIFASFFHKRLAAPPVAPAAPEENHQLRQEVPDVACINTSSEPQDQRGNDGHEPTKNSSTNNSDADEISELEQVVMQKTFTRAEFDHLMELLRSRTVEPVILEPAVDNGKGENENASGQGNGVVKYRSHGNFSSPAVSLTIPKDESASPVEVAKTFMGCMPSEVSPSTLTLRKQVFQEDTTFPNIVPYVKPFNLPAAPRSAIRFSGIAELPENGYQTPKPSSRSEICRMSCSPYFKIHPTTNIKGGRPSGNGHTGPSLSQMTPRNLLVSGGRQVLKRRSSVLDSDSGSFGPIRRIRQKSYLMSPSKDNHSTPLNKDVMEGSSVHRPSQLDELKHNSTRLQDAHDEENKISYKKVIPIPPKSTETARKILQQLDKLVPSPKEKSSEPKVIAREESPYLTHNVLSGRAPRSTEDLYSLKSFNVQGRGSLDTNSDSRLSPTNSLSRKQYSIQENGPLKSTVLADKLTSEGCSTVNAAIPSIDANPGTGILDFPISGSVALPPRENRSSQMSTPEDSLVLDDDKHDSKDAFGSLSKKRDKLELRILKNNTAISETEISERDLMPLSKSMHGSNSLLFREADTKASGRPADAEKDTGFKFPVTNGPSSSKLHLNPNMHMSSLGGSDLQKEQTVTPDSFAFSFAASVVDTAVQNVGASDATMATSVEGSNIGKGGEMPKAGVLFKSFGKAVSSGIPTTGSAAFGFSSSTTPSQSNGSLHLSSLTSPVSAAHTVTHCDSRLSSTFATSTVTSTSMSSLSSSSSAPLFSTVTSFQFGSSTSIGAPVSVTHPVNKSVSPNLEKKPVKAVSFSTSSSSAPCTSSFSIIGSSSSSTLTTSAFSHSDGSSSSLATSAAFPSSLATSDAFPSSLATSAAFPSTDNSSLAPSSTFSNTGRSIFGFSASAHSSTLSFSFASNSSQNLTTTSGASAGSVFRTQSTQSGNASSQFVQSSTSQFDSLSSAPTFGLIKPSSAGFGGSPFGSASLGGSSLSGGSVSSNPGTSSAFVPSATTTSLFSPGSQPCTSSAFGFTSGSTSPSTGTSFGLSSSASGSSTFSSSTGTAFSFTSVGFTTSSAFSTERPVFGMPTPTVGFSSGSLRNDQMNIEDSMTDDTNQSPVTMVSTFGQSANSSAVPNSAFGSAAVPSGGPPVFQFVGHQSPTPQSSLPFQAGNLVPPGGGFSVGSGGGEKSGRKFIKVKRDKLRKR